MMDWRDNGIMLAARPHGETSAIVTILTREHGRHAGLARGARSARGGGLYQPGNRVAARWRGRLSEHLGNYTCELEHCPAARLMDDPDGLAALAAACAVAEAALAEREPLEKVYEDFGRLIDALESGGGGTAYAHWERDLLADLGFGLDLSRCAATGMATDLVYVSPKTGRAVSRHAGAAYHDKLLPLPSFLITDRPDGGPANSPAGQGALADSPPPQPGDLLAGLQLTGYFLNRHVFSVRHAPGGGANAGSAKPPPARTRLVDRLAGRARMPAMTTASGLPE